MFKKHAITYLRLVEFRTLVKYSVGCWFNNIKCNYVMAKIIIPKNELKKKVGNGGFKEESINKAQTAIDENVVDFKPIAAEYLQNIRAALANFDKDQDSDRLYSGLLDQLTQLRAQGAMFHYSAITAITDVVVDLLDSLQSVDSKIIEIVNAYEKCASILIKSEVKQETSPICLTLTNEIKSVCLKYKQKYEVA
jgi:hypothetical protein